MTTPVIRLVDVGRRYTTRAETIDAVIGVSLSLNGGELVALVGPSGSGKSTLVNLMIGAETPDAGAVERSPSLTGRWNDIAFVPQGLGLIAELSIRENVGLAARLGFDGGRPTDEVLDRLGLMALADRRPDEVSLGEQQRAAVARAILVRPTLLVADEPTAHQDEANASLIMTELRQLVARGSAVLVATHEQRVLASVDRAVVMEDGRIIAS